jgi:hypothetical protein
MLPCSHPNSVSWPSQRRAGTQAGDLLHTLPNVSAACACLQLPLLPHRRCSECLACSSLGPREGRFPTRIHAITTHSTYAAASFSILLTEYFRPSDGRGQSFRRHPNNTAREAKKAILFRESQKKRYFLGEKCNTFLVNVSSICFSSLPSVSAWKFHQCDSRKALQLRVLMVIAVYNSELYKSLHISHTSLNSTVKS